MNGNESTQIRIKINTEGFDQYAPDAEICVGIYESELIENYINEISIQLRIYYNEKERLGDKIMWWILRNDWKLLDRLQIEEIFHQTGLIELDITDTMYKSLESGKYSSERDSVYFTVYLNRIRKVYDIFPNEPSQVFLNLQSFDLIETNYGYNIILDNHEKPFSYKPRHCANQFVPFGSIAFKPEHRFSNLMPNSAKTAVIKKEPRFLFLTDSPESLTESEIKKHIELLCCIYSFYSGQEIDYNYSKIYADNKLYVEIKNIPSYEVKDAHGVFRFEFSSDPRLMAQKIDPKKMIKHFKEVKNLITRFNYALHSHGEAKFMVIYSVLEQIRNLYLLPDESRSTDNSQSDYNMVVDQEYKFKLKDEKRDKEIRRILRQIADIVIDDQKQQFINEVHYKVLPIRLLTMATQFKNFFDHINIHPEEYKLDFIKIQSLRNSIFHGIWLSHDQEELLATINEPHVFPKFVGRIMLHFFGVKSVRKSTL